MKNQEKIYVEELIKVIRPVNKNHIFNDEYERVETYGEDGIKIVLLKEKS